MRGGGGWGMVLLLPKPGHRNPVLRGPQNTSHAWVRCRVKKGQRAGWWEDNAGVIVWSLLLLSAVSIQPASREWSICQKPKWVAGTLSLQSNPSQHCSRLSSSSQWRSLPIFARAAFLWRPIPALGSWHLWTPQCRINTAELSRECDFQ